MEMLNTPNCAQSRAKGGDIIKVGVPDDCELAALVRPTQTGQFKPSFFGRTKHLEYMKEYDTHFLWSGSSRHAAFPPRKWK